MHVHLISAQREMSLCGSTKQGSAHMSRRRVVNAVDRYAFVREPAASTDILAYLHRPQASDPWVTCRNFLQAELMNFTRAYYVFMGANQGRTIEKNE